MLDGVPLLGLQLVMEIAPGPGRSAREAGAGDAGQDQVYAQLVDVDRSGRARSAAGAGVLDVAPLAGLQLVMEIAHGPARSAGEAGVGGAGQDLMRAQLAVVDAAARRAARPGPACSMACRCSACSW